MQNTVRLLINHYLKDEYTPSRQVAFVITEDCLKDYLNESNDTRTVHEFLDSYDSDESDVIYEYASDDGRVLSSDITYCDDFEEAYEDFIMREKSNGLHDMSAGEFTTKEHYYWNVYLALH